MKKFTLIALAIMASATSFAQTTLWDGENTEITNKNDNAGFWGDGSPVLVDNPETDGINNSTKCIKFTMTNASKVVKLPFKDWIQPSMNGSKRISLMIRKNVNENVMVELSDPTDGSAGYWKKQVVYYTGEGKWQKLVFDYTANGDFDKPGIMTITAQTGNVEGEQEVYIDNIVIEDAPKINGKLFSEYNAENKITGNVKLTGAWMKGSSMNADVDPWQGNTYNDYEYFHSQADNITSVDIREAQVSDIDINQFFKNPNTLVYTNEYYEHNNIIVNGKAKSVALTDDTPFSCFEAFDAAKVSLTRTVREGINSFVLPFYTTAGDLEAEHVATFKSATDDKVTFATTDHVDANMPFITIGLKNAAENKEFTFFGNEKRFEVTPTKSTESTPAFKGVYAPQSAKGLYGITDKGELQKGSEKATINSFHAFYQAAEGQAAPAKISFEGEATGINNVAATTVANSAVYDLSGRRVAEKLAGASLVKGIYVVNGKKVVVK